MIGFRRLLLLVLGLAFLLPDVRAQERSPRGEQDHSASSGFAAYEVIAERNIFDPNRSPSIRESDPSKSSGPAPDSVDLLGTWLTDRQKAAFTEGSKPGYTGAPTIGAVIGGWRIVEITTAHVLLEKGEKKLTWPVGRRIERGADGEWELAGEAAPAALSPTATTSSAGGGEEGNSKNILQMMLERHKRETNQ